MPDLRAINDHIIDNALAYLPAKMDTVRARVMLLAIGLQESRFKHRDQLESPGGRDLVDGPAMGFWQFERGGGVRGVLRHQASRPHALRVCRLFHIAPDAAGGESAVWHTLERNDYLACVFARLLLWTDLEPLPEIDDAAGAWDLYLRTWRPGKPHRATWDAFHAQACALFETTP